MGFGSAVGAFVDLGTRFVKIGKVYRYPDSVLQDWIGQRVEMRPAA